MCEIHALVLAPLRTLQGSSTLHLQQPQGLALVDGNGKPVVCFVPGTHELNEVKA